MADFEKGRGVAAMDPPSKGRSGSGGFFNFIRWDGKKKEGDTKYIAFLTNADRLMTVQLHEWIVVGKHKSGKDKFGFFIDRRDRVIGEDYDDLTDRLDCVSKRRTLGTALELEPVTTKVNGKNKVTGFQVKLESFNKQNENGDEVEVQAPVIGTVNQSRGNFWRWFASYAESYEPIEDVPFEVKRQGGDSDTGYIVVPINNVPVDYSNLFDHLGNLGALRRDELAQLQEDIAELDDDKAKALLIGERYLDLHLDSMGDGDVYAEQVGPLTFVEDKFGNRKAKKETTQPSSVVESAPAGESKIDRVKREFAANNL